MTEQELTDSIIKHALELQRLSDGDAMRAEAILREMEADLRAILNSRTLAGTPKRELEALLKETERAIASRYVNIAGVVDVEGIVQHVADRTVDFLAQTFPNAAIGTPTLETLSSLSRDILIEGSPASAWWAKQAQDTAFKFAGIVRRGVLNGETNEQIVRKVAGGAGEPGILDASRRNVRTLVHSSVMTAANRARLETYRKNARFASGVRWLATLDSHVCTTCAALDGAEWDFDGKPIGKTRLDFQMPPAHMSCRCLMSVIPGRKALDEVFPGLADELAGLRDRATAQGPQKVTMTEWLKRNPAAAEEVLGAKRVAMFQAGTITLTDLVTKSGRALTLDELR